MGQKDGNAESCVGTQVEAGMAETEMDISQGTILVMGGEVEKDSETASSCQQEIDDDDSMTQEEHEHALKIYKAGFVVGAFYVKHRLSIEGGTAPSEVDIARMAEMRGNIDIALMFPGHDPTCHLTSDKA